MPAGADADAVDFPSALKPGLRGGPEYSTTIVTTDAGHEQRNANWQTGRSRWSVSCTPRLIASLPTLIDFFTDRRGRERAFTFEDPIESRDVIARFDTDDMSLIAEGNGIGGWEDIPIVEVRDEDATYSYTEPELTYEGETPPAPPAPTCTAAYDASSSLQAGTYWCRVSVTDTYTDSPDAIDGPLSAPFGPVVVGGGNNRISFVVAPFLDDPYSTTYGDIPLLVNLWLATSEGGTYYRNTQWTSATSMPTVGFTLPAINAYSTGGTAAPILPGPTTETEFPFKLTRVTGGPNFKTVIHAGASAHEKRFAHWTSARRRFVLEHNLLTPTNAATLVTFFRQHKGRAYPFWALDPVSEEQVLCRFDADHLALGKDAGMVRSFSLPIIEVRE